MKFNSLSFFSKKRKNSPGDPSTVPVSELLPPEAKIITKNPYGIVYSYNSEIKVLTLKEHHVWKKLSPLFFSSEVEEIWIFKDKTVATIRNLGRISIKGIPSLEELEDIIIAIIATTGLKVDMRRPRGVIDIEEWRVSVQLASGGQVQIVATRLSSIPPLTALLDPTTAARLILLLLRPSVLLILGPPGSGKTTLLNSLIGEIAGMYPHLHIAVVEKYRELTFREGWFSWIIDENIVEGVRWAMRYYRPDLVVVGEIMAEDFWSIVEPSRSGLPTITTFHSPTTKKAVKVLSDALRARLRYGNENSVLQYVDVFIQTYKRVTPGGVERGIESILLSDGQRLIPMYVEGQGMAEEDFVRALPDQLYVGPTISVLNDVFTAYGIIRKR